METLKRKHEEGVEISGGVSRAFVADSRLLGGFFWVGGRRGEERREACLFFLLFFFFLSCDEIEGINWEK